VPLRLRSGRRVDGALWPCGVPTSLHDVPLVFLIRARV